MNTTSSQTTHAPSHLREQFQEWLDSYEPNRLQEIDLRPVASLLDALADCGDVLPADFCDQLEIPKGSSYAEAVADVRQWCAGLTEVSESPVECGTTHVMHRGPSPLNTKILNRVATEISLTAMCCHEALRGYWERNDEGFEAMRRALERALLLLGYPMPDYAARDQEWREENDDLEEPDE